MGLFGGSSKSKTASTVVTGNVANYGEGPSTTLAGVSGSNVTINQSDYGAVEAGRSLAQLALETNGAAFSESIAAISSNAKAVVDKTLGIAAKTQVSESAQFQDTLLKIALIVGAAVAALAFFRGKA